MSQDLDRYEDKNQASPIIYWTNSSLDQIAVPVRCRQEPGCQFSSQHHLMVSPEYLPTVIQYRNSALLCITQITSPIITSHSETATARTEQSGTSPTTKLTFVGRTKFLGSMMFNMKLYSR